MASLTENPTTLQENIFEFMETWTKKTDKSFKNEFTKFIEELGEPFIQTSHEEASREKEIIAKQAEEIKQLKQLMTPNQGGKWILVLHMNKQLQEEQKAHQRCKEELESRCQQLKDIERKLSTLFKIPDKN